MKIAFSTLGCPNYDWKDIYSMAKDLGFDGIEIREIRGEFLRSPFSVSKCEATAEKLRRIRLEVPCLSTGCVLNEIEKSEENIAEIVEYIKVASKLGMKALAVKARFNDAMYKKAGADGVFSDIAALSDYLEE